MRIRIWPKGKVPPWRRGFPFFFGEPRSSIERLRAFGSKHTWKRGAAWKRLLLGGAMTIGWPVVTFSDAVKISAKRAREGRAPFLSSFNTLYRAALTRNVPPAIGALYEWALDRKSTELADVLLPLDLIALQQLSIGRGAVLENVQDKARFERVCRANRLPCVPTLAVFDRGASIGEDVLRERTGPLFVKALTGNRGAGAQLWRPGGRGFISSDGKDVTADELIHLLRPQNCIVQPALEDHPALQGLGTVALSNLRIVTVRGRTIPSTAIAASMSLAVEPTSLTGHEGFHCGIDVTDGTVANTLSPVEEDDRLRNHDLIGFSVPHWSECATLVCEAHNRAFPHFASLGWDVALTAAGPILLEANVSWGMLGHQRLTGPFGKTVLADVIDELIAPVQAPPTSADRSSRRESRSLLPAPRAVRGPAVAKGRKRQRRATRAS